MRKLVLKMQMSLDGYVAGPKGEVDWIFASMAGDAADWIVETLWNASLHIMGRKTFFDMAPFWPASTWPYAAPMNDIPKLMFSQKGVDPGQRMRLTRAFADARAAKQAEGVATPGVEEREREWAATPVAIGDLKTEIVRLKQQDGKPILAHGGAGFVQGLVAENLIDEYRLMVHPVALGSGKPLFPQRANWLGLQHVETRSFRAGAVAHVYRPA